MKDYNSYNLNGLRVVFWGMLLDIVANIGFGAIQGLNTKFSAQIIDYIGMGCNGLAVLSILLVIIGLSQVGKYSFHFRRARNYFLWSLLLAVVAIGLIVVAYWMVDRNQDSSGTMLGTVAMIIAAIVLILLAGWLGILRIKQMMNGCADIARQNDERKYAAKCTRAWVYYMFFLVVSVVLIVILAVVAIRSLLTAADTTGGQINSVEDMAGGFQYFFYVAAGLGASLVLLFLSYLLVMGKVNGTLMRYHRVEIPVTAFEEDVPAPPAGDSAELEVPAEQTAVIRTAPASKPVQPKSPTTKPSQPKTAPSARPEAAAPVAKPETVPKPVEEPDPAPIEEVKPIEDVTPEPVPETIPEPVAEPETIPEPVAEPELTEPEAPSGTRAKPAASGRQSAGKHAKPSSGFLKQSSGKHAKPKGALKAADRKAAAPVREAAPEVEGAAEAEPAASKPVDLPLRQREAETMTIEMPKVQPEDLPESETE